MRSEPLRQDNQRRPCGRIVDCEERLQEIEAVAGHRVRLKGCRVRRRLVLRHGRLVLPFNSTERLQLHHIAIFGEPARLDLATRHHAFPCWKYGCSLRLKKSKRPPIQTTASYAVARLSLTALSSFVRWHLIMARWNCATFVTSSPPRRSFTSRVPPHA